MRINDSVVSLYPVRSYIKEIEPEPENRSFSNEIVSSAAGSPQVCFLVA